MSAPPSDPPPAVNSPNPLAASSSAAGAPAVAAPATSATPPTPPAGPAAKTKKPAAAKSGRKRVAVPTQPGHYPCTEPDCDRVFRWRSSLHHHRTTHARAAGIAQPRQAPRKRRRRSAAAEETAAGAATTPQKSDGGAPGEVVAAAAAGQAQAEGNGEVKGSKGGVAAGTGDAGVVVKKGRRSGTAARGRRADVEPVTPMVNAGPVVAGLDGGASGKLPVNSSYVGGAMGGQHMQHHHHQAVVDPAQHLMVGKAVGRQQLMHGQYGSNATYGGAGHAAAQNGAIEAAKWWRRVDQAGNGGVAMSSPCVSGDLDGSASRGGFHFYDPHYQNMDQGGGQYQQQQRGQSGRNGHSHAQHSYHGGSGEEEESARGPLVEAAPWDDVGSLASGETLVGGGTSGSSPDNENLDILAGLLDDSTSEVYQQYNSDTVENFVV